MRVVWIGFCMVMLVACGPRFDLAPVSERTWQERHEQAGLHRVRPGETLYSVAFRYDLDYRQLASYNHLYSPYSVRVGQVLRLSPAQVQAYYRAPTRSIDRRNPEPIRASAYGTPQFNWPAAGRVVRGFSPQQGRKGMDIVGRAGERIHAAAPGVIAYAGSGLMGYGNLIIIKHNEQYLTAYGNNARNLVKEGQRVSAGQVIGEMGRLERRFLGVHFEIRHRGRPVNPMIYLKNR